MTLKQQLTVVLTITAMMAAAYGADPNDKVIAVALGKEIKAAQIEPSKIELEQMQARMSKEEFDNWHRRAREGQLIHLIMQPLMQDYIKANKIDANQAELKQLAEKMQETEQQIQDQQLSKRDKLVKELAQNDPCSAKGIALKEQLEKLDRRLAIKKKLGFKPDYDVCRQMVTAWKINKSLYREFGGRVIFQQAGPEPVDAYRQFLEREEKAGRFKIYDDQAARMFWNYFTNDKMHTFYKDPNEAAKLMNQPWWMTNSKK